MRVAALLDLDRSPTPSGARVVLRDRQLRRHASLRRRPVLELSRGR